MILLGRITQPYNQKKKRKKEEEKLSLESHAPNYQSRGFSSVNAPRWMKEGSGKGGDGTVFLMKKTTENRLKGVRAHRKWRSFQERRKKKKLFPAGLYRPGNKRAEISREPNDQQD